MLMVARTNEMMTVTNQAILDVTDAASSATFLRPGIDVVAQKSKNLSLSILS